MQWEEEEITLADMAYFNSLMCTAIWALLLYSSPHLATYVANKSRTRSVRPKWFSDTTVKSTSRKSEGETVSH
jgi:hypothetical protein